MPTDSPIGTVARLTGDVSAESAGESRVLEVGAPVYVEDKIVTGDNGKVEIGFEDGTRLFQAEASEITLDEYIYDTTTPELSKAYFSITQGTFRMVTGEIVNMGDEDITVESPLAVIGIRGTITLHQVLENMEKHGIETVTIGEVVSITDEFGNVQTLTVPFTVLDVLRGTPIGQPRPLSPEEREAFDKAADVGDSDDDDIIDNGDGDDGGVNFDDFVPDEGGQPKVTAQMQLLMALFGVESMEELAEALHQLAGETGMDDDTLIFTAAALGTTDTGGGGSSDNIHYGTPDADTLTGTSGDDTIYGCDGDDVIYGLAGNDVIRGGPDADEMYGGAGDDIFEFETDDVVSGEIIDGGDGTDVLKVISNNADFLYADTLTNIEEVHIEADQTARFSGAQITGKSWLIQGSTGTETLEVFGTDGNDVIDLSSLNFSTFSGDYVLLNAGQGDDYLVGSTARDYLYGGIGNDSLHGGSGADILSGDAGNDELYGGAGNDILTGGAGAMDYFKFTEMGTANADYISDYETGTDLIYLASSVFTNLTGPVTLNPGNWWSGPTLSAPGTGVGFIMYDTNDGKLYYTNDGVSLTSPQLFCSFATTGEGAYPGLSSGVIMLY